MYALLKSGSKQYKVSEGQIIKIEKINIEIGSIIEFKKIIMISNHNKIQIGTPFLKKTKIFAEVINHNRNKKIFIIKFKRRKHFYKNQGHRQKFSLIKIIKINY